MEYFRIVGWINTCQLVAPVAEDVSIEKGNVWGIPKQLEKVDTMVILLCGDFHSPLRPPTLLLVWHNIVSSVGAMEVGLTAARCAETTAVAVDFAGNIMSLVQFGFEVSERGLLYGLGVVVKEAISIHGSGGDYSNLDNMDSTTAQYTRAAVRAIHSGQRVARNVHMLSEDEHVGAVVQPLLAAVGFLSGHGWLWGKEEQDRNSSISFL